MPDGQQLELLLTGEAEQLARLGEHQQNLLDALQRQYEVWVELPEARTWAERVTKAILTIPLTMKQQSELKKIGQQMGSAGTAIASTLWRQFMLTDPELIMLSPEDLLQKYSVTPAPAGEPLYQPTAADRQWLGRLLRRVASVSPPEAAPPPGAEPTLEEVGAALIERPRAVPTTLHQLTTDEILKALTTPLMPRLPTATLGELTDILVEGGMSLADAEQILSVEEFAKQRTEAWQATSSAVNVMKAGAMQLENIEIPWTQWALLTVTSPFLVAGEMLQPYFRHWDYPRSFYLARAGMILKETVWHWFDPTAVPPYTAAALTTPTNMMPRTWATDMEADFQENLKTMNHWEAASKAWEDYDAPWALKLLIEVAADPVTYIGWGLYTKICKPIPVLGKLVGGLERGYIKLWDKLIFDRIVRAGRWVAKPLTGKAFYHQQKVLAESMQVISTATNAPAQRVLPETAELLYKAGLEAFKVQPQAQGGLYSLGKIAIDAVDPRLIGDDVILGWARAVDSPIIRTAKDISTYTSSVVDDIMDLALRGVKQPAEAADMLLNTFGRANTTSKVMLDTAKAIVTGYTDDVFRAATALVTARPTDRFGMRLVMRVAAASRENFIKAAKSAIYSERMKAGMIAQMFNKVDPIIRLVWVDTLQQGLIYPFARANLVFGAYGIGNVFEGIFKPMFAGISPYRPRWLGGSVIQPLDLYAIMTKKVRGIGELATATTRPEIFVPRAMPRGAQRTWQSMLDNFLSGRFEFPDWAGRLAGKKVDLYSWLVERPGVFGTQQRADYMNKMLLNFMADEAPDTTQAVIKTVNKHLADIPKTGVKLTDDAIVDYMKWSALVDPDSAKDVFRAIWNTKDVQQVEKLLGKLPMIDSELAEGVLRATASGDIFKNAGRAIDDYAANLSTAHAAKLVRSPEVVAAKFQSLANDIVKFKPTTYEQVLGMADDLVQMVDCEQALIQSVLRQAEYEGRMLGRAAGAKTKMFESTWKGIGQFLPVVDDSIESIAGHLLRCVRELPDDVISVAKKAQLTDVIGAQVAKQSYIRTARVADAAFLAKTNFAEARRLAKVNPAAADEWWTRFHTTRDTFYKGAYEKYLAELEGVDTVARALVDGLPTPPRIDASARKLTVNDVCELLGGGSGDDLLRSLNQLELQTLREKAEFIATIKGRANLMAKAYATTADDLGFTAEKVGAVYDELIGRMGIDAATAPPLEPVFKQVEELRQGLWKTFENKGITESKHAALTGWVDDLADDLGRLTPKAAPLATPEDALKAGYLVRAETPGIYGAGGGTWVTDSMVSARTYGKKFNYVTRPSNPLRMDIQDAFNRYVPRVKNFAEALDTEWVALRRAISREGYDALEITAPIGRGIKDTWIFKRPKLLSLADIPTVPPVVPGVIGYNTAEWHTMRQSAHDLAAKEYFKDFADYMHPSVLNQSMRAIFPYWTYEAHRWFWLPREFLRHPGMLPTWGSYMDKTDRGYVQLPWMLSANWMRGTIFMGGFTRLVMRDFPEFYDNFPEVAGAIDFFGRYGFYPNILIMGALALTSGADPRRAPQMWELMPPWTKSLLGIYFGTTQDPVARAIMNRIAPDRYKDYYSLLIGMGKVSRAPQQYPDIDPIALWTNRLRGVALTPEEQKFWDNCIKEAFRYGVLMEQGGIFRLRPEELSDALKEVEELIFSITGITAEQQRSLRARGLRYNDYIRKFVSVNEQRLLNELDAFTLWAGRQVPIIPSLEAEQMVLQSEFWRQMDVIRKAARTEGLYRLNPETGEREEKIMDGQEVLDALGLSSGNMRRWRTDSSEIMGQLQVVFGALKNTRAYRDIPITLEDRIKRWEEEGIMPLATHPSEELMHKYYEITVEQITEWDEEGNEIIYDDWDTYWALTRAMTEAIGDVDKELQSEFLAIIDFYLTPLQKAYRDVSRDYLFPYRTGVRAAVLALFTEEEKKSLLEYTVASPDRRAELREITRADGTKLVSQFTMAMRDARRTYRMLNPELDAWLRFFGYTEATLTPEADILYHQYRDAWGMPY